MFLRDIICEGKGILAEDVKGSLSSTGGPSEADQWMEGGEEWASSLASSSLI